MTRILLVEGRDDLHVVLHLSRARGVCLRSDEVSSCGGIESLLDRLRVDIINTKEGVLGIIVDADDDVAARWESIRDRLHQAGYRDIPREPERTGTVIAAPSEDSTLPLIGVWIMPDNNSRGTLEDFLSFLVPSYPNNRLFEYAQHSVSGIPDDAVLFPAPARSKAVMHTWLAWQEEPGKPFGVAITKRFLDSNSSRVDDFVAWLRALLEE